MSYGLNIFSFHALFANCFQNTPTCRSVNWAPTGQLTRETEARVYND